MIDCAAWLLTQYDDACSCSRRRLRPRPPLQADRLRRCGEGEGHTPPISREGGRVRPPIPPPQHPLQSSLGTHAITRSLSFPRPLHAHLYLEHRAPVGGTYYYCYRLTPPRQSKLLEGITSTNGQVLLQLASSPQPHTHPCLMPPHSRSHHSRSVVIIT